MPTKYVLHGGIFDNNDRLKEDYLSEIVSSLPKKKIQILFVLFAKEKEKWGKTDELRLTELQKAIPYKEFEIVVASDIVEEFLDQTHNADIIYFSGGHSTRLLLDVLKKIPFNILIDHLNGKVVVGSSAGANALSKYYVSSHKHKVEEGLGILPIKVFCHYNEKKEPLLEELEAYKEHLTSFALPEHYFVVIQ